MSAMGIAARWLALTWYMYHYTFWWGYRYCTSTVGIPTEVEFTSTLQNKNTLRQS